MDVFSESCTPKTKGVALNERGELPSGSDPNNIRQYGRSPRTAYGNVWLGVNGDAVYAISRNGIQYRLNQSQRKRLWEGKLIGAQIDPKLSNYMMQHTHNYQKK